MRKGEMIVATLFMVVSVIIIYVCVQIGVGWEAEAGPKAGMVPFWLAVLMLFSSAFVFYLGWKEEKKENDSFFVNLQGRNEVLRIAATSLIFTVIFVYAGCYFAMLIFSPLFVRWLGKHSWVAVIAFTIIITMTIYLGMEIGLKIPLPRSPLYMQDKFFI